MHFYFKNHSIPAFQSAVLVWAGLQPHPALRQPTATSSPWQPPRSSLTPSQSQGAASNNSKHYRKRRFITICDKEYSVHAYLYLYTYMYMHVHFTVHTCTCTQCNIHAQCKIKLNVVCRLLYCKMRTFSWRKITPFFVPCSHGWIFYPVIFFVPC